MVYMTESNEEEVKRLIHDASSLAPQLPSQPLSRYLVPGSKFQLPYDNIEQAIGATRLVVVFVDIAGNDRRNEFWIASFYAVAWESCDALVRNLKACRAAVRGGSERLPSFKDRKDSVRKMYIGHWLDYIRKTPSILYSFGFPKSIQKEEGFREAAFANLEEAKKLGIPWKKDMPLLTQFFMAFIPLLTPLLKKRHRLTWCLDNDPLLDTAARAATTGNSIASALTTQGWDGENPIEVLWPKIAGEFREMVEELLSVPDLIAGALSSSLSEVGDAYGLLARDLESARLLEEFADFEFPDVQHRKQRSMCKVFFRLFSVSEIDELRRPGQAALTLPTEVPVRDDTMPSGSQG